MRDKDFLEDILSHWQSVRKWVDAAKGGEEEAVALLHLFADRIIENFLRDHPAEWNEQVGTEAIIRIVYTKLYSFEFDPENLEPTLDDSNKLIGSLTRWCKSIITHLWIDKLRQNYSSLHPELFVNRSLRLSNEEVIINEPQSPQINIRLLLDEMMPEILDAKELDLILKRMNGSSYTQIMDPSQAFHYPSVAAVKMKISRIVEKVEHHILEAAGYRRLRYWAVVYKIPFSTYIHAAQRGKLQFEQLFGPKYRYCTADMMKILRRKPKAYKQPKVVDPTPLGYLVVSQLPEGLILKHAEYRILLQVHKNRLYISKENYEMFKQRYKRRKGRDN